MNNSNYTYFSNATKYSISIAILTLVGALLRLPGMDLPITGDLAGVFIKHFQTSWDSLLLNFRDGDQRTSFILLSKIAMGIFGENEFAFRLPALLSGIFALPLAYKVGVLTTASRTGAWIGTLILTFSFTHLHFIRDARGYSLTVFLALAMALITYKLLEKENFNLWAILFLLTGLGMILIVPTNIHFLVGIGVFYIITILQDHRKPYIFGDLIKLIWPFILLFGVICGYFLYNLENLIGAIGTEKNYGKLYGIDPDMGFSLSRFADIFPTLISPWQTWLYMFLFYGLICLYKTRGFLLFASLIVSPIILVLLSDLLGPPRVYVYWLPFFFLLIGFGMGELLIYAKSKFSNFSAHYIGIIILAVIIFYPLASHSDRLFQAPPKQGTTLKDAKTAIAYIKKNTSRHDLIIVPFSDRVLRYYTGEDIALKMLSIIQEGHLNNILFLGPSEMPPYKIPDIGVKGDIPLLKNHIFNVIQSFGNLRLYKLTFSIKKRFPFDGDRDYENHLNLKHDKTTQIDHVKQPKIAGNESLLVRQYANHGKLMSRQLKIIENNNDGSFILVNFATGYKHRSEAQFLFPKGKSPEGDNYWNSLNGVFVLRDSQLVWKRTDPFRNFAFEPDLLNERGVEFIWQIKFIIFPIPKGMVYLTEGFRTWEKKTYFDGFQSFLLESKHVSE